MKRHRWSVLAVALLALSGPATAAELVLTFGDDVLAVPASDVTCVSIAEADAYDSSGIVFEFDLAHAAELARLTRAVDGRQMRIALDERLIAEPVVRGPIAGGSFEVNGFFEPDLLDAIADAFPNLADRCDGEAL